MDEGTQPGAPPGTPPDGSRGLSTAVKWALVAGAVGVLVIAFLVARGGDGNSDATGSRTRTETVTVTRTDPGSPSATTTTTTGPGPAADVIRVAGGKPAGGVKTLQHVKGDTVRLVVHSDTADEIHVHGYDLKKDVAAGDTATFRFRAGIEGRFVIELEHSGTQIALLQVNPS